MEEEPAEDAELVDATQTLFDAFRAGDNIAGFDLLERATCLAQESGNHETYIRLKTFQSNSERSSSSWTSDPEMTTEG